MPLAYLMIQTSKEASSGAKEQIQTCFLNELKKRGVEPEYTLTDKDWSEINAMRAVWPNAKHQLCLWHSLRALKKRLAKNKDPPAFYDVDSARQEFPYMKSTFVPRAQQTNPELPVRKLYIYNYSPNNISLATDTSREAIATHSAPCEWSPIGAHSCTSKITGTGLSAAC